MMRGTLASFVIWAAVLQSAVGSTQSSVTPERVGTLLSIAGALAALTVMAYRLGVWRQDLLNTKDTLGATVTRFREESNQNFDRLDRRFDAVDRYIEAATERRVGAERWQAQVDTRVLRLEQERVA